MLITDVKNTFEVGYYLATERFGVNFGEDPFYTECYFDFEGFGKNYLYYHDDIWLTEYGLLEDIG